MKLSLQGHAGFTPLRVLAERGINHKHMFNPTTDGEKHHTRMLYADVIRFVVAKILERA